MHEKEFFAVCTALNGECVAVCGGNPGGAGLISSLILLGHVRAGLYQMAQSIAAICSHNSQP